MEALGTPESLAEAVREYEQAIALRQELPLDVHEYRSSLASGYESLGLVYLAQSTNESWLQAKNKFTMALSYAEALNHHVLKYARIIARSQYFLAQTCLLLRSEEDIELATDAADAGLQILRDLECGGVFLQRKLREHLFSLALKAYLAGQPQFIPELVLEHLDPDNPGAAANSLEMHTAAIKGINEAIYHLRQRNNINQTHVIECFNALQRLQVIRTSYFSGTPESAMLQALNFELAGNPEKSEHILRQYNANTPSDPAGYQLLGLFYTRRKQTKQALDLFEQSITMISAQFPKDYDSVYLEAAVAKIDAIAGLGAALTFGEWPVDGGGEKQILKGVDRIIHWLTTQYTQLRQELKKPCEQCFAAIREHYGEMRETWFDQEDNTGRTALVQLFKDEFREKRTFLEQNIASLPTTLGQFLEGLWAAYESAQKTASRQAEESDGAEQNQLEAEAAKRFSRSFAQISKKLYYGELQSATDELQKTLGAIWADLSKQEQQYLAIALQLLPREPYRFIVGFSLCLAVETDLLEQVFTKVRLERFATNARGLEVTDENDHLEPRLVNYFNGKQNNLMLGVMVGSVCRVLYGSGTQHRPVDQLLYNAFNRLPRALELFGADAATRDKRKKALNQINVLRIKCDHPENPITASELEWLWQYVVSDEQNAFFRYFRGAFLPYKQ